MIQKEVLAALIGAGAVIIGALITVFVVRPGPKDVLIDVVDADSGQPVPTRTSVTITGPNGKTILGEQIVDEGRFEVTVSERGEYKVAVTAVDYEPVIITCNPRVKTWKIRLKYVGEILYPVSFTGWMPTGDLEAAVGSGHGNTVTLKSTTPGAGYLTTGAKTLAGRRLVLDIAGTGNSSFYNGQLFKLEADDIPLKPEDHRVIIEDGYIPANDGRVGFIIPAQFNGKINIVFYKATLRDLQITAYYQ